MLVAQLYYLFIVTMFLHLDIIRRILLSRYYYSMTVLLLSEVKDLNTQQISIASSKGFWVVRLFFSSTATSCFISRNKTRHTIVTIPFESVSSRCQSRKVFNFRGIGLPACPHPYPNWLKQNCSRSISLAPKKER